MKTLVHDSVLSREQRDCRECSERAKVLEPLNNGLFRLEMANGRTVTAHVAKDLRMAFSRLLNMGVCQAFKSQCNAQYAQFESSI